MRLIWYGLNLGQVEAACCMRLLPDSSPYRRAPQYIDVAQ